MAEMEKSGKAPGHSAINCQLWYMEMPPISERHEITDSYTFCKGQRE